jgi:hypothetical protein
MKLVDTSILSGAMAHRLAMSNTLLRQLIGKVWRVMLRHHELS